MARRGRKPRRRPFTCTCGTCHSCRISAGLRRRFAEGLVRRRGVHANDWSPEQDEFLRARAGRIDVVDLARLLTECFGVGRAPNAVRVRAYLLGASTQFRGYDVAAVARLFGVTYRKGWGGPKPASGGHLLDGREWREFPSVGEATR